MQRCLKCANGWRGAGYCWGTWMTSDDMEVSNGLEFLVVARPGVGHLPAKGEDEQKAARATQKLVIGVGRNEGFGGRLGS